MDGKKEQGKYSLSQKRSMLVRSKAIAMTDKPHRSSLPLRSVPESDTLKHDDDDVAFPSLPDDVLKILGLYGKCDVSQKNLNEPDVEEQFAKLSLAFKTDKYTLSKRLELQQRQRDVAEKNIDGELKSLRESLNTLNQLCIDSDMREVITKTQQHVDIVQQTTMRMSSRAETYGAIQQEERMNCAFETMLNYVEHLKLLYDKEHLELEEYRRLLAEHNLLPEEKKVGEIVDDSKRNLPPRSHSLSSSSKPEPRSRLLSYVCLLNTSSESKGSQNGSATSSSPSMSPKSRRASLPVGPMSSSTAAQQQQSFNPASLVSDFRLNDKKVAKNEAERKKSVSESSCSRKDSSSFTSRCEERKNSECCQVSSSLLSSDNERPTNKDSSPSLMTNHRKPSSQVEQFPQTTENDQNAFSNDYDSCDSSNDCKEITISTKPNCLYHLSLFNLTMRKGSLHWDGGNVLLHVRYLLSALLAVAALCSLVMTFLPNGLVISFS